MLCEAGALISFCRIGYWREEKDVESATGCHQAPAKYAGRHHKRVRSAPVELTVHYLEHDGGPPRLRGHLVGAAMEWPGEWVIRRGFVEVSEFPKVLDVLTSQVRVQVDLHAVSESV